MSEISFVSDSTHVATWQQKAEQLNPNTIAGVDPAEPYSTASLSQAAGALVANYPNIDTLPQAERISYCRYLGQAVRTHLGGYWVELLEDATNGEFAIYIPELEAVVSPLALLEQAFADTSAWEEIAG